MFNPAFPSTQEILHKHVSMLILAFSSLHNCAEGKSHGAANIALDCLSFFSSCKTLDTLNSSGLKIFLIRQAEMEKSLSRFMTYKYISSRHCFIWRGNETKGLGVTSVRHYNNLCSFWISYLIFISSFICFLLLKSNLIWSYFLVTPSKMLECQITCDSFSQTCFPTVDP